MSWDLILHGPIGNHKTSGTFFSKLQILDLSHNEFIRLLPRNYFENLKGMRNIDEDKPKQKYLGEYYLHEYPTATYYQDTAVVTIKGLETEVLKIETIFTAIDLESNKFQGEIPEELGWLKFLQLLNVSHNSLTGHIPSSLANLLALESLVLSSNELGGEIPMQLTSQIFWAMLNLLQNQFIGSIPQGKQFAILQNDLYNGNSGLCGFPLSWKCRADEPPPPPPALNFQEDNNDSMFGNGFDWKVVLIKYGCGLVLGLAMGYVTFKMGKLQWLVRLIEGEQNGKVTMPNNQRPKRRRS